MIHIRRSWTLSALGKAKTKLSKSDMPLHPVLAQAMQEWRWESLYSKDSDWVFASVKTTLDIYAHANSDNKMAAQGAYLEALAAAKEKALESARTESKAIH